MVDLFHQRMAVQVFDDPLCVQSMPLQTQRKGFHPLQKQKCIERRDGGARVTKQNGADIGYKGSRADRIVERNTVIAGIRLRDLRIFVSRFPVEFSRFHNDAAQSGAVSSQELCRGMNDDVCPVFDRTDQIRRAECIVNYKRKAVLMGNLRDRIDIRNITVRVPQSFQEDCSRIIPDGSLQLFQIVSIHKSCSDAVLGQSMGKQIVTAAINGLLCNDMPAVCCKSLNRIRDRSCAGSHCQSSTSALEGRNPLLQHFLRGVGQTTVNISGICKTEPVCRMLTVPKYIGSCLINRYSPGIRRRICLFLSHM